MDTVLFNVHDIVLFITIYQCLLFSIFLFSFKKKGKRVSNLLLALFLLSYAAIPMDTLVQFGEAFRSFAINISPNFYKLFEPFYFVGGPLLLFYVRSLVYKDFKITKYDYLYFTPFAYFIADYIVNWFALDYQTKMAILSGDILQEQTLASRLSYTFRELFRTYFTVMCLLELRWYQKQIKHEFADIESVDLTWLKTLVIGFLVIHVIAVLVNLSIISSYDLGFAINFGNIGLFSNYLTLVLISVLIFFSLGDSSVFKGVDTKDSTPSPEPQEAPIDPEQIKYITQYMDEKKPYLNHLLRLESLANQLDIAPRTLSNIINRHFEKSFFEFINTYRIEESKRLLLAEENKSATMLDVMDMAGFNSKATFNTLFKKTVGVTPTQFRKEKLLEKSSNEV